MRVPMSLLTDRIQIAAAEGRTGQTGPQFAVPRTVRARLEGAHTVYRTSTGATVTAAATALIQHDVTVAPEDQVTVPAGCPVRAGVYTVLRVRAGAGLHHPAHNELLLDGPR